MDVVLKEEIPVSKGQVSAEQGQELWKHFVCLGGITWILGNLSVNSLSNTKVQQDSDKKQLHHVLHSKQKQFCHPYRVKQGEKREKKPTKPSHPSSSLQLWITATPWPTNTSQVHLRCLLAPTTVPVHIYHNSAGCFAKSEILMLTDHLVCPEKAHCYPLLQSVEILVVFGLGHTLDDILSSYQ